MIISHSHKFIFIKSYKTAGTSVEAALSQICEGDDVVTPLSKYEFNKDESGEWVHRAMNEGDHKQHDDAATIRASVPEAVWNEYTKISICRNPWDRAVSFCHWEYRGRPEALDGRRWWHRLGIPYDEMKHIRPLFRDYVRDKLENNDKFYFEGDRLIADFMIRYEHLEEDFARLCERLGVEHLRLPRLKTGIRKKKRHYSDYYDDESREIVARKHANDIKTFGYTFERG